MSLKTRHSIYVQYSNVIIRVNIVVENCYPEIGDTIDCLSYKCTLSLIRYVTPSALKTGNQLSVKAFRFSCALILLFVCVFSLYVNVVKARSINLAINPAKTQQRYILYLCLSFSRTLWQTNSSLGYTQRINNIDMGKQALRVGWRK